MRRRSRGRRALITAALVFTAALFAAPAANGAVVRAEATWDETIEHLVDVHVSDLQGRISYIDENEIPFSVRTDTPGLSSFTDNETPNSRTLCFWLDNYGDNDVSVDVTLRAPNGTTIGGTQTIPTEGGNTFEFLGSSPTGLTEDECLAEEPPVDPDATGPGSTVPTGSLGLTPLAVTGARAAALKKCKKIEGKKKKKKCIKAAQFKPLSSRQGSGH
jgi:hypothetical protein